MIYTSEEMTKRRVSFATDCAIVAASLIAQNKIEQAIRICILITEWEVQRQTVRYRFYRNTSFAPGGITLHNPYNEFVLKHGCVEFKADYVKILSKEIHPKENPPPGKLPPLDQSGTGEDSTR